MAGYKYADINKNVLLTLPLSYEIDIYECSLERSKRPFFKACFM